MRATAKHGLATVVVALAACAAGQPPAVTPPPLTASAPSGPRNPPPPARDDGRLPDLARPERYSLSLMIDPREGRFSGTTRILMTIAAPTWYVVLHGMGLDVKRAIAKTVSAEIPASVSARLAHGRRQNDELVLTFASELPAGRTTLLLAYEAAFGDSLAGLYRVKDGQAWYGFTQFEATDARRAFPCFDEPGYKVSFDLSLTVPKGMIAVANTPETARSDADDKTTFEFATTPPLPTYLVAFAVGDFDVRSSGGGGAGLTQAHGASPVGATVPIRLIATKGKAALGELAIEVTTALTRELASYFGIAYPYPKLDIVAVPNLAAGAMENAGLITFRDTLLLLDPEHASASARRQQVLVIAHELAHQWFGDLVTMAWWNDIWLNEGFATWAEAKAADRYKPSLEARLELIAGRSSVMDTDSLGSARAVRQPVTSTSEAEEAFDSLTYDKGAAVLSMLEHSIGETVFQKGVRAYLSNNAWKNATAEDLLQELNLASGKDVAKLALGFLDRAGVPNVAVSTACNKTTETVTLQQAPWRRLGQPEGPVRPEGNEVSAPPTPKPPWWVPMRLTSATGERVAKLLEGPRDELELARCAPWVFPNSGLAGYYRFSLDDKAWGVMVKSFDRLEAADRIGFLSNLWAQTRAGELDPAVVLRALPVVDGEKNRYVIGQEIDILKSIDEALVGDDTRAGFRRYAAARLSPHAKRVAGTSGKRDDDAALLDRVLLPALGDLAEDDATLRDAERVSQAWLKDPSSVDPDLAATDLALASRRAGQDRVDALRAAIRDAKTPENEDTALRALATFGDSATLEKALDVLLTDEVKTQDVYKVLRETMKRRPTRKVGFEWIDAHWDALRKKLPEFLAGRFFGLPASVCSADERAAVSAFFQPRVKEVPGAERPLAEALESASLCEALHDKYADSVHRFFAAAALAPAPPTGPPAVPPKPVPPTPAKGTKKGARRAGNH
jgi:cytosol alanyl aminopeptidase